MWDQFRRRRLGACIEDFWVGYVEELRPGIYASLIQLAPSAFDQYVTVRCRVFSQSVPNSTDPKQVGRIGHWPTRLGIAVLAGLVSAGVSVLLPISDPLRLLIGLLSAVFFFAYSPVLLILLSGQAFANKATTNRVVELKGWESLVAVLVRFQIAFDWRQTYDK